MFITDLEKACSAAANGNSSASLRPRAHAESGVGETSRDPSTTVTCLGGGISVAWNLRIELGAASDEEAASCGSGKHAFGIVRCPAVLANGVDDRTIGPSLLS